MTENLDSLRDLRSENYLSIMRNSPWWPKNASRSWWTRGGLHKVQYRVISTKKLEGYSLTLLMVSSSFSRPNYLSVKFRTWAKKWPGNDIPTQVGW